MGATHTNKKAQPLELVFRDGMLGRFMDHEAGLDDTIDSLSKFGEPGQWSRCGINTQDGCS